MFTDRQPGACSDPHAEQLVGQPAGQPAEQLTGQSAGQHVEQFAGQRAEQLPEQPAGQLPNPPIGKTATVVDLSPDSQLGDYVCAIGVFDGLHEGHRFIIDEAIAGAGQLGLPAIAITFDQDPDELFSASFAQRKLLSNEDRIAYLAASGVDSVFVIPFEPGLALLGPLDFLDTVIAAHGRPRGIHVGADFRFGHHASGTVEDLKLWGARHGCEVFAHELFSDEGASVTATRIRDALQSGDLALANKLLMRPYYLWAQVVKGRAVGKSLGFPTANLLIDEGIVAPADGVYAGAVIIDGTLYRAAISVGIPATFESASSTIEAHILDYEGDLYGRRVKALFFEFLRPMVAFDTVEELKRAVFQNIEQVRAYILPKDRF